MGLEGHNEIGSRDSGLRLPYGDLRFDDLTTGTRNLRSELPSSEPMQSAAVYTVHPLSSRLFSSTGCAITCQTPGN